MSRVGVSPLRQGRGRLVAAAFLFAMLSGCSSVSNVIADHWPTALGGLPEGVPPRPEERPAYMPVHDLPPPRENKPITATERKQLEADIAASRGENTREAEEVRTQAPQRLPPLH